MPLSRSITLPDGQRVRLRLTRPSDRDRLRALFTTLGLEGNDFVLGRLTRFDPRKRTAVCATVFLGGTEAVVGYGAIDRFDDRPDLLLADEATAPGVGALLAGALCDHAARDVA